MKKSLFTALIIMLVLALAGWLQASPTAAHPAITYFTVDTLTDGHDSKLSDEICHNDEADGCTLRAAIEQAATIATSLNTGVELPTIRMFQRVRLMVDDSTLRRGKLSNCGRLAVLRSLR